MVRAGQHIVVLSVAYCWQAGFKKQKEQQDLYTPLASGQQFPSSPSAAQPGLLAHVALACGSTTGGVSGNLCCSRKGMCVGQACSAATTGMKHGINDQQHSLRAIGDHEVAFGRVQHTLHPDDGRVTGGFHLVACVGSLHCHWHLYPRGRIRVCVQHLNCLVTGRQTSKALAFLP